MDGDTRKFALETLQRWWRETGPPSNPDASRLLVSCHLDGLVDTTSRLWELGLQDVADALRMQISVCHLPAGTSRWSNVEQQMVYRTFDDRRGRPMACPEVLVTLIGTVAAKAGATVRSEPRALRYESGRRVSMEEMAALSIKPDRLYGEWNYTQSPRPPNDGAT